MKHILIMAVLIISIPSFFVSCGQKAENKKDLAERLVNVITTTGMIGDAVRNVGGERVIVSSLMGPGVDPHTYKASAGDVEKMSNADIIFYNGLHLEGAMIDVFDKMKQRTKVFAVADGVDRNKLIVPDNSKGTHDPHIWFDVSMWIEAVAYVRDRLIDADPKHKDIYQKNYNSYHARLEELHNYALAQAETVPEQQRVLVTAHDAFHYFGKAYGFQVRGLQGISTASEAGTSDVQQLAKFIGDNRIPAIFVESSVPKRSIEAVQAAVRAKNFEVSIGGELFSDAMGSAGTPEATYLGMVRHNINTICRSLKGE